jgi:hypothetical protein
MICSRRKRGKIRNKVFSEGFNRKPRLRLSFDTIEMMEPKNRGKTRYLALSRARSASVQSHSVFTSSGVSFVPGCSGV